MKEIRMLAAIMFTDMVGYTALMQENEWQAKILSMVNSGKSFTIIQGLKKFFKG